MTTTLTIAGEILPCFYSLSRDINVLVLNMHPCMWKRLTLIQHPVCHLLLFILYICLFFESAKKKDNMVNAKCSSLTGIEAWTSGLIV